MKIAVLGAGAMGSVFGGRLALIGADVTLLDVNDAHVSAINDNGLHLSLDEGEKVVSVPAMLPTAFEGPVDLIILLTKSFDTDAALTSVSRHLDTAKVLCLQNGLGNLEALEQRLPRSRIVIGVTLLAADFKASGEISSHGNAATTFYSADGIERPILNDLAGLLTKSGIPTTPDKNVECAIWEKAAFNCAFNALCALAETTPGVIGNTLVGRRLAFRIAKEVVDVANARSIPVKKDVVFAMIEASFIQHANHEPSMLQDKRSGRRTEVETLNGAVAKFARDGDLDAPANALIADILRLAEAGAAARADNV